MSRSERREGVREMDVSLLIGSEADVPEHSYATALSTLPPPSWVARPALRPDEMASWWTSQCESCEETLPS